jgi:hypothetical protein
MEGLWRQRLTARWTLRTGKRTACATSEGPAPGNEYGKGMHGPPPSRSDVRQECTAGWPKRRESHGHRVLVVVRDWESQSHGKGAQVEDDSRGRGCETRCPEAVERAHWRAVSHGNGSARFGGGPAEKESRDHLAGGLPNLVMLWPRDPTSRQHFVRCVVNQMGFPIVSTKLCTPDNIILSDQHLERLTKPMFFKTDKSSFLFV